MVNMQKENEEKETQEECRPKKARLPDRSEWGVGLNFGRLNELGAGLFIIAAVVVLILNPSLLWEETDSGEQIFCGGFLAAYASLAAFAALLCVVKIKLPELIKRIFSPCAVLLLPLGAFYAVDIINGTRILSFTYKRGFANYICYLMVFALIYAICRRAWITAMTGGAIFLTFGIANYFVTQFRGQPILPWDFQSFATAMTVSGGYEYVPTQTMILFIAAYFCVVLLCAHLGVTDKTKSGRPAKIIERLCALAVAAALAVLIFPMDILTEMGISVWAWNQKTSSEITGVMTGFFANVQFVMVDKPDGYSVERVEALGDELAKADEPEALGTPEKQPTIVVVMNESMTDLTSVGELDLDNDNLPFIHSLQQSGEVIWGTAYSSVYGGNTCNSEYEFLTGNTTAFMPTGSKPYQQYVDDRQTALPSIMKSYGYKTVALHPGNRSAWQRDTAYPYLGFDEFKDYYKFDVDCELTRTLTSDRSCYEQVVYEYENRDENSGLFIFNVTIQNHGGFENEDYPTTVRIKNQGLASSLTGESLFPQTEQYLSLTKESDSSFEWLIDYFSQQEDPVVVLFFGDHWPNLETDFLSELLGTDADSLDFENMMREYEVPFLIWANYPLEGEYIDGISINYLSGLLLRAAGMQGTDYTKYLENLRQTLPVITAVGMIDADGEMYNYDSETPYDDLLNEYAVLQYNNAFGGEEKVDKIFTR